VISLGEDYSFTIWVLYDLLTCLYRDMSLNDLQMKEIQDQFEAEQYFSVSSSGNYDTRTCL